MSSSQNREKADRVASEPKVSASVVHMKKAIELEKSGDEAGALRECEAILKLEDVPGQVAARTSEMLRKLGQPERADGIRDRLLAQIDQALVATPDDAGLLREAGILKRYFGNDEEAEKLMRRAVTLEPGFSSLGITLTGFCLKHGDPEAAAEHLEPMIGAASEPGQFLLTIAGLFATYGEQVRAEAYLQEAEPHCTKIRTKFESAAAAIRGQARAINQHAAVVDVFDGFASTYDEVLGQLENHGPQLVRDMIERIGLEKKRGFRILDAGCGTGLCAVHLKPYAAELTGADISVGMLESAREKEVYDFLVRTDLSVPYTYPEGTFHLVVSSDVMVYFGDLEPIFVNIFNALKPGGWFIFSVEKAQPPEPEPGYRIGKSGRYSHTDGHLLAALKAARFSKPRALIEDTMRMEFGKPVAAYVVAVQKPALFM